MLSMQRVWYFGIKEGFVEECFTDPKFVSCLRNDRTYSQVSSSRSDGWGVGGNMGWATMVDVKAGQGWTEVGKRGPRWLD